MSFHVGQLVVCVDDQLGYTRWLPGRVSSNTDLDGLRRSQIYTVREVCLSWADEWREPVDCIHLVEITRHVGVPYAAERFRPITDDKLAIFRQHLIVEPTESVLSA